MLGWVDRGLWFYRDEWDLVARSTAPSLQNYSLTGPTGIREFYFEYRVLTSIFNSALINRTLLFCS